MKHIVVLAGSYYPNYSAVGICARNIVDELKKNAIISVVSQKTLAAEPEYEHFDGYDIHRITTFLHSKRLLYKQNATLYTGIKKIFYLSCGNFIRTINYIKAIIQKVNIRWDFVRAYKTKLENIESKRHIDAVVCFCFPFETLVAGKQFKQYHTPPNTHTQYLIGFVFDNYSMSASLHRTSWNRKIKMGSHIKLTGDIFNGIDKILALHTLKAHFNECYPELVNKIEYVEHPLLVESKYKNENAYSEYSKLIYTGSLNKNCIEPFALINMLELLIQKEIKIKADFYIMGNMDKVIQKFSAVYPDNIFYNGYVPFERVEEEISKADIMLCISENAGIQMSSKIFRYISAGKPIILLYYTDNDINKKILERYPLYAGIRDDKIYDENEIGAIIKFINDNKNQSIDFTKAAESIPEALPEYTVNIILKSVL